MSRYRYTEASFTFPAIDRTWIKVPSISTGISILEAIGEGSLCLTGRAVRTPRYLISPTPRLSIDALRGMQKRAILSLFDRESDIECGRQEECGSLHTVHFPDEIIKRFKADAQIRLRHFAALVTSGIKIGDWNIWSPIEYAALDAGLSIDEREVAYRYEKEKRLNELLADIYPFPE